MNSLVATALACTIVVAVSADDPSLSRWLHRAVVRGDIVRLVRGIYIPRAALEPLQPWHIELLRVYAAAAQGRIRQPLCGISAARVWGVPLLHDERAAAVDALGWHNRATRRVSDVHYWATADDQAHVVEHHGVILTDLPRTVAELGVRSSFERTVAAIDWAVRVRRREGEPVTTIDDIRAVAESLGLVRGRARLERALMFADGRSESPGESWARVLIHELGFEAPDLQHEYRLFDGQVFRTDFRWASIRLAGEFDGLVKYRVGDLRGGLTAEQVVIEEKQREDAVRATGDGMLRCVWSDLRDRRRLGQILEVAGVPRRVQQRRVQSRAR
jgi:hypothetical protein